MKLSKQAKKGFTLPEMMITLTISAIVLTSAYATLASLAKGSRSMINFSEMNTTSRFALEMFGRDARMARDVEVSTPSRVRLEREIDGTTYDVEYVYDAQAGTFRRTIYNNDTNTIATGVARPDRVLIYDVSDLNLNYYTLRHAVTDRPIEVKHVQLEAVLERQVISLTNTNYIISARFMMRNKDVSN